MKRVILLIIISVLSFSGYTQNTFNQSKLRNNSIAINDSDSAIKIYPNPCKQEKVTIEYAAKEIAEIQITNIAGKEVLLNKFQFAENKKQIQLTDIPNGIYLVRIKTTEDKLVVKKLMLAKD